MADGSNVPRDAADDNVPRDAADDAYWLQPPNASDGEPFIVNCRLNINSLTRISTAAGEAAVELYLVCHWTDPRLIGYDLNAALPPKLWGPRLEIMGLDMQETHGEFSLGDAATGRCKRGRLYRGTINALMDLLNFPFDQNALNARFFTSSTWLSFDESIGGMPVNSVIYNIRPVQEDAKEGNWCTVDWSGDVHEFKLHGMSSHIEEQDTDSNGAQMNYITVGFHLSRESGYYFWKVLLPLWTLTVLNFTAFEFQTEDLASRMSFVATNFLAGYAMLYVVGDSVPKTSFLTSIDMLISFNNFVLFVTGIACRVIYALGEHYSADTADKANMWVEIGLATLYIVVNVYLLLPAYLRQRKDVAILVTPAKYQNSSDPASSLPRRQSSIALISDPNQIPTVKPGYQYIQFNDLPTYDDPSDMVRDTYVPGLTKRTA